MNSEQFLAQPHVYFNGAYEQFCAFGGPCIYFHKECLRAGELEFCSDRHIEMLYATLTAWGMHRMGDSGTTKTKLTDWPVFKDSLQANADALRPFRKMSLLNASEAEYADAVSELSDCYRSLHVSTSGATIVAHSKALFHLLPEFIAPIDRQDTLRFFRHAPENWRNAQGQYRMVMLPAGTDAQFRLFQSVCVKIKRVADRIDRKLFERERREHGVTPPKAIDNAIVNYVRIVGANQP